MTFPFPAHRIIAFVVLIAAGAWVVTGEFSAVGSEAKAEGAEPAAATTAETTAEATAETPAAVLRTVAVVTPTFIDHAREIRISGATEADKKVVLAARSNGIVAELSVVQGAEVAADTVILRLDGAETAAMVTTAEASLAQATEQLQVGEALFKRGSLPELELTSRRAAKAAAESALTQAVAERDRRQLSTPFAGIVDSVEVEVGEWVTAGTPITTILALDPIVVKAEVSELDVGYVSVGSPTKVRLVNGVEATGTVRHVAKQASEKTRTFAVEVAMPNTDRAIPSGMTAELSLFAPPQKAVMVPRSVITISDAGEIGLRVVGADNIAQFVPVALLDDTDKGLILGGIPADVRIIVAGQDLVRDGDEVIARELTPAEIAAALK